MVGEGGVEPPRPYGHTDLNRARLPFRHSPEGTLTLARRVSASNARYDRLTVRERTLRGSPASLRTAPRRACRGRLRQGVQRRRPAGRDSRRAAARDRRPQDRSSARARVLAPNEFVVELGDHDYHRIEEWAEPLGDELAAMVREHAADARLLLRRAGPRRLRAASRGRYRRVPDPQQRRASPTERPRRHPPRPAHRSPDSAGGRAPTRAGSRAASPHRPRLILAVGREESAYFLVTPGDGDRASRPSATSGSRIPACRAATPSCATPTARSELVDLGSTNGVTVNGTSAGRARLRDGDRIDVGLDDADLPARRGLTPRCL